MIAFWVLAVLLAALAAAALLPPLLRRRAPAAADAGDEAFVGVYRERLDELEREHERGNLSDDGFAEAKAELERELLTDYGQGRERATGTTAASRATAVALALLVPVVALLVPVVALLLYAGTGAPGLVGTGAAGRLGPEEIRRYRAMEPERRIEALEPFVAAHPGSPWGWSLLARAYHETERYGDAVTAYVRAREAGADDDAWLIARQAEALIQANNQRFGSSVRRLLDEALARDPDNPLALMLAGHAEFAEGDRRRAAEYWQRLAETMPADDERRALIEDLVARARGTPGPEAPATAGGRQAQGAGGADGGAPATPDARVTVRVRLADDLRGRAGPQDTVFVFARRADAGGGPPLAVARTTVEALPAEITLSDADAMTPQMTLSTAQEVVVTARVSRGGDVMAQSGDLQGRSERIAIDGVASVDVVIDRLVE